MSRSKLQQIVRLRGMLRKWRRLTQKARSLSNSSSSAELSGQTSCTVAARVPPGHLAVYVGQERVRFVIKTSLLTHPLFKALLKKTEEEIGFHYEGGLTIPCDVSSFRHLLLLMKSKHSAHNIIMMMSMMHTYEHDVHVHADVHEHHHGFPHLLRELLRLHFNDNSAHMLSCGISRLPLPALPQSVVR